MNRFLLERRPKLPAEVGTTPAVGKGCAARSEVPSTSAGPYSIAFPRTIASGSYPGSRGYPTSCTRFPDEKRTLAQPMSFSKSVSQFIARMVECYRRRTLTRNGGMVTDISKRNKGVRVGLLVSGRNLWPSFHSRSTPMSLSLVGGGVLGTAPELTRINWEGDTWLNHAEDEPLTRNAHTGRCHG